MEFEWDETKQAENLAKHGVGFEAIELFEFHNAVVIDRFRHGDGELRYAAIGPLKGKLFTVIFTWRGARLRIISFRRANRKEEKIYEQKN